MGGREGTVAPAAFAALGYEQRLPRNKDLADEVFILRDHQPKRNRDPTILTRPAVPTLAHAMSAASRLVVRVQLEIIERLQSAIADQEHRSTPASVAAVGSSAGYVFLTAE